MAMKLSNAITMLFLGSVIAGAVMLAMDAIAPKTSLARAQAAESSRSLDAGGHDLLQSTDSDTNHTLAVQLWTVLAAAGAMGLGLVFFLVRVALGRVKPPPPQEEAHH
jgi:hypothetical protein